MWHVEFQQNTDDPNVGTCVAVWDEEGHEPIVIERRVDTTDGKSGFGAFIDYAVAQLEERLAKRQQRSAIAEKIEAALNARSGK